jgi:uncharacterized membrane protein YhaH (DUF805 family)
MPKRIIFLQFSHIYLWFILFVAAINIFDSFFKKSDQEMAALGFAAYFGHVFYGLFFVFVWSVAVRRLHDMGASSWQSLLMLVPIVNAVFVLVLLLAPGNHLPNKYGDMPWLPQPKFSPSHQPANGAPQPPSLPVAAEASSSDAIPSAGGSGPDKDK